MALIQLPVQAKAVAVAADLVAGVPVVGLPVEPTVWERELAAALAARDRDELGSGEDEDGFVSLLLGPQDAALVERMAAAGRAETERGAADHGHHGHHGPATAGVDDVDDVAEVVVAVGDGVDPWLGREGMVLAGEVITADRAERAAQAAGLVALAGLAEVTARTEIASSGRVDPDFLTAIVATSLGVGPRVAATRVDDALALTTRLPRTLAGLAGGWLSLRAAQTMVAETVQVAEELVGVVEAGVFDALGRRYVPAGDVPLGGRVPFDLQALTVFDPALGESLASVASPARLRVLCRRVVKVVDAEAVRLREERARGRADVRVWPDEAGMSWLGALVPDADAAAAYHRINTDAHRRAGVEGETRSIGQLRAATLTDLLLSPGPDGAPGPAINLDVHVDADGAVRVDHVGETTSQTLTDLIALAARTHPPAAEPAAGGGGGKASVAGPGRSPDDHPGGWASVPPPAAAPGCTSGLDSDAASKPVSDQVVGGGGGKASVAGPGRSPDDHPGGWASVPPPPPTALPRGVRVFRPPMVSCPGQHDGPGPRFASSALTAAVVARDKTCRFPGCAVPALDCDLDHVIPHPHGPTCVCNLICLCRRHHRTKTFAPGWRVIHHGHGRTTWITPTGQTITTDPDPPVGRGP